MPRRKKNGQSPARLPAGPGTGSPLTGGYDGAAASRTFAPSTSAKEKIFKSMQEMFSHLDPEVIFIVLSECDFKVENAMDSLLELSDAAEVAAPLPPPPPPPPVSGFERTAAALLSPRHFSEPGPDSSRPSPPSSNLLTEELDLLVEQELETLAAQQGVEEGRSGGKYSPSAASLAPFPPPPFSQQALPELLQSSLEPGSREASAKDVGNLVEHVSGASSPLDQLSTWDEQAAEGQRPVLDFTHLIGETSAEKPKPPLDLAASGRPSAFQVYKKQEPSHGASERPGLGRSDAVVGGARSKVNMLIREPPASPHWNPEAPAFSPHIRGNQAPVFITPVAQTPSNWPSHPRQASPWLSQAPVSQAPLKPSATIPKSWALPAAPPAAAPQHSRLRLEGKLLVLLRGAPGSGKSTLARALLEHNPGGVILSTDEYFIRDGKFLFDPTVLEEAHGWNHKRAKEAFEKRTSPIIIDNTNMQGWEMRPYVVQALRHGYKVLFKEPDTWWKSKPKELERRTTHNVPGETIRRMLNGYERFVTVQSIMGSQMPEWKHRLVLEKKQPAPSASPCPDLVGPPGLIEGCDKSRSQLFSSLPDVSSIGRSGEVESLEDGAHKSTESLDLQLQPTDNPDLSEADDGLDLGELDAELDAQLEANHPIRDQRMPDCIVESVMNEDRCREEMPVAFSESIGQRVRRERSNRREERTEPADLVKDANQSEAKGREAEEGAEMVYGEEKLLNFVGDWPSEGALQQRQARKSKRHNETQCKEGEGASPSDHPASDHEKTTGIQSGPHVTEFQKLLDLIQTGAAPVQTSSSRSHSVSPNPEEELDREGEACDLIEESYDRMPSGEEGEQNIASVNSGRSELPDCVLDRKITDSCAVGESGTEDWATGRSSEIGQEVTSEDLSSAVAENPLSADSLDASTAAEANVDGEGSHSGEGEVGTDVDTSNLSENGRETESGALGGSSQERKQRQSRRSGKQCKLALTFSQICPASSWTSPDCPDTEAQEVDGNQEGTDLIDVKPNFKPDTSLDPSPDMVAEFLLEPPPPPTSLSPLDTGCSTQTEPQDYALLWRLNRPDNDPDAAVTAAGALCGNMTVLSGDSSRFVPELSSVVSAAVAVHPSGRKEVPYRVVHEKSTQVEEKELGVTQDRLESLRILSRHFKLVSFDTLEDLYDKCHQDLEWTTNLLLDSGERFFRDEEGEEEDVVYEGDNNASSAGGALCDAVETSSYPNVLDEHQHLDLPVGETAGMEEGSLQSALSETEESGSNTHVPDVGGAAPPVTNADQPHETPDSEKAPQPEAKAKKEEESPDDADCKVTSEPGPKYGAWCGTVDNGVIIEELRVELEDDAASMDEVNRLLQAELEEMDKEEKRRKKERGGSHLDIQSVELKLPTELALQLTELFGPVGIDPGTCSDDDFSVQMDLNLHQKWKESIQERQRQAALSFHLLQESSSHWGDSQVARPWPPDRTQPADFLISADGYASLVNQPEARGQMPVMDHWNVSRPHVSLRDIIKEEQALQHNVEKTRQSRADLDRRDGAALLKENQLYSLFPTIDRHFLQDIFRDHNYQLRETEMFLRSLLNEEPVKTVVAPEAPRSNNLRAASKEREKRQKPLESVVPNYQDTEDPEYEDFRAEASLQRKRQLESFAKAAEAYKQGRKEVASFYAQQGHLHGQRMRDANHRAAVQIFQRVNSSLLPKNILDLHGLHVDEALEHLAQVLEDKTAECEHGLCRPQLSVITGRGNHSQGGVARIRPAVIDYLTNKHYRFTEPKPGLVLVSLR
ncbi:NEDD4-binding protein 2 [Mugil cephalus]|uniref:NEDD4-binding protein 2 n=1 Tax=Mugil cephalus TaxID=48193 RepID=UPI001FB5E0B0|nr:NEDD4-binding protein 2 [Mugil cephalus]